MFVAVDMASPGTTSLQRTKAAAPPVSMVIRKRTTAMFALERGDVSAYGCIIIVALIIASSVDKNQIGSRLRRSLTADARNTAANISPIQRPDVVRNFPGVSAVNGSIAG